MTQEVLKLALEFLEDNQHYITDNENHLYLMMYNNVIEKCKEALAQPEQEPVADDFFRMIADRNPKPFPLPQRTWVGLTIEEIAACCRESTTTQLSFAQELEAKLKDKNCVG